MEMHYDSKVLVSTFKKNKNKLILLFNKDPEKNVSKLPQAF